MPKQAKGKLRKCATSTAMNIQCTCILRASLHGGRVTLQGRVTLPVGSPSFIVFHRCVYMSGRVTLDVGSPYYLGRVTLPGGLSFCLLDDLNDVADEVSEGN